MVAILHGSEVWVGYGQLSTGVNPNNLGNYWGYGVVMVVTVIVILLTNGAKNLSRRHERIMHQEA